MASEAVRRFVRLSAISLSSRLRTGSSCASFFPVHRPMKWEITHDLHPGQARFSPEPSPFSELLWQHWQRAAEPQFSYLVVDQESGK